MTLTVLGWAAGPVSQRWRDSLPWSGIQGDPVLFFHDTYIGSSGLAPASSLPTVLANLWSWDEASHSSPSFTDVTSKGQFYPSWLRASSGMTRPHSLSRL